MKTKRLTADREVLEQYRQDFSVCGKCKICQSCHVQEVFHERFWRNCPSGTRFGFEAYYASGKLELANALVKNEIEPTEKAAHALYTCMLCGSCEEQCYGVKQLYPLRVIELLRERAVRDGWGPPAGFEAVPRNIEGSGNLFGEKANDRAAWAEGLGVKDLSTERAGTCIFVGCQSAYRSELWPEMRAAAAVLDAAGADFGILGNEESCCGSPLLELGMRDEFERVALQNIEKIRDAGVERLVTACGHGTYVLKEEYGPQLGIEVLHLSELVAPLIERGELKPGKGVEGKVAYHDPCMLGRRLEVYDAPRKVLSAVPGLELVEFQRAGNNALCCGGGGMAWWAYPEFASWVARERLFEADFDGIARIATACPLCQRMLSENASGEHEGIEVYGMWSLLAESLGAKPGGKGRGRGVRSGQGKGGEV